MLENYIIEKPSDYFSEDWEKSLGTNTITANIGYINFINSGLRVIYPEAHEIPWKYYSVILQDNSIDILFVGEIITSVKDIYLFMEEAWRVLKPGGVMRIDGVSCRNDRWIVNPANVVPIVDDFFGNFSRDWCVANNIKYNTIANFRPLAIDYIYEKEWEHRPSGVRNFARTHYNNVVRTIRFALGAIK